MRSLNNLDLFIFLSTPLSKRIEQQAVERWAQSFWSSKKNRLRGDTTKKDAFVMMFPPPNITGNLHLGHALTASIEDAIIRHRNMSGMETCWVPGFDHAGLATQSIVEKVLWNQQALTRQKLGCEEFTKFCNEWKDLKRKEMKDQLDRLGLDLDYSKEFFTTDSNSSYAVQTAFKRLFNKGLIYRDMKQVHWSRELQTTLSDIEVTIVDGVKRYTRTNEEVQTREISQWFIDCKEMARNAVDVVQNSSISMIPENYKNSWSAWLLENGIHDWCISRQSWWGHKIPAFKSMTTPDVHSSWVMADSPDEAKSLLDNQEVIQDTDVLDTWFSSSLLPLTISGWPDENLFSHRCESGHFPLDIMETGFDILTFWVSKMVMMSIALENKIPFKLILLHGMICDSKGKKMSKSQGNVIDPGDLIEGASLSELQVRTEASKAQGLIGQEYLSHALDNQKKLFPNGIPACGADGLRAYLLSQDFQQEVIKVQIPQIEKVRRLMNKLWNIYRFSIMIIEDNQKKQILPKLSQISPNSADMDECDKKLLDDLSRCITIAQKSFWSSYNIHHIITNLDIFWNVSLSTQYLPKLKACLSDSDVNEKTRMLKLQILIHSLVTSTKLIHPIMPHMTEFLYQKLSITLEGNDISEDKMKELKSIYDEPYPVPEKDHTNSL